VVFPLVAGDSGFALETNVNDDYFGIDANDFSGNNFVDLKFLIRAAVGGIEIGHLLVAGLEQLIELLGDIVVFEIANKGTVNHVKKELSVAVETKRFRLRWVAPGDFFADGDIRNMDRSNGPQMVTPAGFGRN
jgi:hypothetical protein